MIPILVNRTSFFIQPCLNGSRPFYVQCLTPRKSKQSLHGDRIRRFLLFYQFFRQLASRAWWIFDIKITGSESTKPKLYVIDYYRNRTINIINFSAAWLAFFPLMGEANTKLSDKFFSTKSGLSNAIFLDNEYVKKFLIWNGNPEEERNQSIAENTDSLELCSEKYFCYSKDHWSNTKFAKIFLSKDRWPITKFSPIFLQISTDHWRFFVTLLQEWKLESSYTKHLWHISKTHKSSPPTLNYIYFHFFIYSQRFRQWNCVSFSKIIYF